MWRNRRSAESVEKGGVRRRAWGESACSWAARDETAFDMPAIHYSCRSARPALGEAAWSEAACKQDKPTISREHEFKEAGDPHS
ncbi:hypothetical protein [Gordoniibacillus kamchatkensis]|uniref:hypothetical protein n=1 Tax=Gordoniibacillus kamchatkensis TaxID=1590651 RepID=UPI0012E0292E|nr:hypothetical protein [Paenibacillus sp. VKM B-2647]